MEIEDDTMKVFSSIFCIIVDSVSVLHYAAGNICLIRYRTPLRKSIVFRKAFEDFHIINNEGVKMPSDKICKTIHQYNKLPVSEENMGKLLEIAKDFQKVKNYTYVRYGGIGSLAKIYPGYTVQNEMAASGYREVVGLPSVYFYLAVFDALADIKSQWTKTKSRILKLVNKNEDFMEEEKHYLRFILKVSNAFEAVLNQKPIELPAKIKTKYQELAERVDAEKLHRYLCRKVRKYHVKLHTDTEDVFSIAERAYRYADHGIYISTKEKRKRVFIPLTDNNQYCSQLRIKLYPQEERIEIKVPVNVAVQSHEDYVYQVGTAFGFIRC